MKVSILGAYRDKEASIITLQITVQESEKGYYIRIGQQSCHISQLYLQFTVRLSRHSDARDITLQDGPVAGDVKSKLRLVVKNDLAVLIRETEELESVKIIDINKRPSTRH